MGLWPALEENALWQIGALSTTYEEKNVETYALQLQFYHFN